MFSRIGNKLNYDFPSITKYYGLTEYRCKENILSKSQSRKDIYPKQMKITKKNKFEPFKVMSARNFDKESQNINSRAPPIGRYDHRRLDKPKLVPNFDKEKKTVRSFFCSNTPSLNAHSKKEINQKTDEKPKHISTKTIDINKKSDNLLDLYDSKSSLANTTKSDFEYDNKSSDKVKTRGKRFQHNKQNAKDFIYLGKEQERGIKPKQEYREFDLFEINPLVLSTHKRTITNIYFCDKTNVLKSNKNKPLSRDKYYNPKYTLVKPRTNKLVPLFDKELRSRDKLRKSITVSRKANNDKKPSKIQAFDFLRLHRT